MHGLKIMGVAAGSAILGATLSAQAAPLPDAAPAPRTEIILHSFVGPEGAHPLGGVIVYTDTKHADASDAAKAPVLYGTTYSGGKNGKGTVFSLQAGTYEVVHSFSGSGKFPQAGVTEGPDGMLYGSLSRGGYTGESKEGYGAIFAMNRHGKTSILHQFQGPEGAVPVAPVAVDAAGTVFGATQFGGSNGIAGTVFKYDTDGTVTVLKDLSTTNCQESLGSLTFDATGAIFGTTWFNRNASAGCVWKLAADGKFSIVKKFDNGRGGREPRAGIVLDASGNAYGVNYYRGDYNAGTLFKVSPDGTETVLHHFRCGNDGGYPYGNLLDGGNGILYGVAASCGSGGGGVVFRYDTAKGAYSVIHPFQNNQTDGYLPIGALSMDKQGNIYGATEYGGGDNLGIVFELVHP